MKITIELSDAQVKGIKAYYKATNEPTPNKSEISRYISGIVDGTLSAPQEAVSDYIKKFEAEA